MPLTSSQRSTLRGFAMQRTADLNIGRQGITPNVVAEIDKLLRERELVKLKLSEKEAEKRAELLTSICGTLGAAVAGTVGRTAALYRYSPKVEKHLLDAQPAEEESIG